MRFSWPALILAPLAVPVLFSVAFVSASPESVPLLGFLILLVPSSFISYGTTIFLFLPCLLVLSLLRPMTGLVLGALVFVPLTVMDWKGSGPDSGSPEESFFSFLVRWAADPFNLIFPVSGLITAGLYWWLAARWPTWRRGRSIAASQ